MELPAPRVIENPGDEETEAYRTLVFDVPESMRRYYDRDRIALDNAINWSLSIYLYNFLQRYTAAVLKLPRTAKDNLKAKDQERLDRCLRNLQRRISADLDQWLTTEPRYHQIIHERVNETLAELLITGEAGAKP